MKAKIYREKDITKDSWKQTNTSIYIEKENVP